MRLRTVAVALLLSAATASADPSSDFAAAVALETSDAAAATTRLEALARDNPTDEIAADALAEAAQLAEDRLFDPARALADWRTLTSAHPDSRVAARARGRIAELERRSGQGGNVDALRRFAQLTAGAGDSPTREQRAQVEAFLKETLPAPVRADATYWLARAADRNNEADAALRWYDATSALDVPLARSADRARALLLLRRGRYDEAEAAYRRLLRHGDHVAQLAYADGLRAIARARRQRAWSTLAWIVVVLFALAHGWVGRRDLRPMPTEVRFLGPVVAVFSAAAAYQSRGIGLAVVVIGSGGLAVSWLAAATRRALVQRRGALSLPLRLVLGLAAAATALAIAYLAARRWELVDQVRETWMAGPER